MCGRKRKPERLTLRPGCRAGFTQQGQQPGPASSYLGAGERDKVMDEREIVRRYASGQRSFDGAILERANLSGAVLSGADLYKANLSRADLRGADLSGANLHRANLSGANLHGANLCGAELPQASLRWADLGGADLGGADLRRANLREADLQRADLGGAHLYWADLREADLSGANVNQEQLAQARSLKGATLPDGTVHE